MKISISGKHTQVGEALSSHVEERLSHGVRKYFDDITHAEIVFEKDGHFFTSNIVIRDGHGIGIIKSSEKCDEPYSAFDKAMMKIEKLLRKHKEKLKKHRKDKIVVEEIENTDATKYVIDQKTSNSDPVTIAEKPTFIEKLSVADAIMKMELNSLPALMFRNITNGRINVVYHRKDGNISWVDPSI